ncbi:hypothetical protein C8R44DRAFT_755255 [Mycena epipterygia]|nr:hypothetical protein C8R44DRAFT_755255 [Mycena epipterygia]
MVWNEKFLDLAFRGKFRIINYPVVLENIGQVIGAEQFNTKARNVKEYNSFMPALERGAKKGTDDDPEGEPVIRIVPWEPAERDQQLEDQDEVPLVTPRNGGPNGGQTGGKLKVPHRPIGHVPHLRVQRSKRTPSRGRALRDPRHDGTTGRESALAQRLQLSPAVDTPIERPVKRRRRDDDETLHYISYLRGFKEFESDLNATGFKSSQRALIKYKEIISTRGSALAHSARNLHQAQASLFGFLYPFWIYYHNHITAGMPEVLTMAGHSEACTIPGRMCTLDLISLGQQMVEQTHAGQRKRKRSPDSPGGGDAAQEPPLIAMRFGLGDRYTFYFDTVEDKWRQIPDGMEPVLASQDDEARALRAKELFGLVKDEEVVENETIYAIPKIRKHVFGNPPGRQSRHSIASTPSTSVFRGTSTCLPTSNQA